MLFYCGSLVSGSAARAGCGLSGRAHSDSCSLLPGAACHSAWEEWAGRTWKGQLGCMVQGLLSPVTFPNSSGRGGYGAHVPYQGLLLSDQSHRGLVL